MIQAKNNKYNSVKELKILNFYSDGCPPCHAFMPNFIEAEKTFGKYFDFIIINSADNIELFQKFRVMGTPTVIILDGEKIVFNQSGVPNGGELKKIMMEIAPHSISPKEREVEQDNNNKKKKWFGLF